MKRIGREECLERLPLTSFSVTGSSVKKQSGARIVFLQFVHLDHAEEGPDSAPTVLTRRHNSLRLILYKTQQRDTQLCVGGGW